VKALYYGLIFKAKVQFETLRLRFTASINLNFSINI